MSENSNPPQKCDPKRCLKLARSITKICSDRKWAPDSPFMLDNPDGSVCYCTCFLFGFESKTSILTRGFSFKKASAIIPGDTVQASGKEFSWRPVNVDYCSSYANASLMIMITFEYADFTYSTRVTEDNLILAGARKLVPAKALKMGDTLCFYSGTGTNGIGVIKSVASYTSNNLVYQIGTDAPLNPTSFDGHLLCADYVVVADFTLQAAYISGLLDRSLLVSDLEQRLQTLPDHLSND
ncbi:MAG TPA: hypothetical protein VGM30_14485 [Puia sp.]